MARELPFPTPSRPAARPQDVPLGYLDYFRSVLAAKLDGLSETELTSSRLPSGWTPLQLLNHLIHVERRWLEWRFEGQDIPEPWGENRGGSWHTGPAQTLPVLLAELADQAARSRAIVERHDLAEFGRPSERWDGEGPARLDRILLHLVQEYARHLGHLDIVRELADGVVGE
ncbi:DinB family protein [Georgenia sp. TF02-10]|uniref:DinB family protein n=1 Tax=Georgenia sp. TF02-10 TaxID=2917725 RepID=UPI001FA75452|nr:DinB family protein [Georgenia sp. TF02-10]UNX53442.1 DinB family protein [Georgenia sp. TF02-10]